MKLKLRFIKIFCFLILSFNSLVSRNSDCSACKSISKSSYYSNCQDQCSNCEFYCSNDFAISRTIFIPRSLTPDSALDLPLGNYQFYHNTKCPEDRVFFDFQGSYFYLKSRKACELAAYFLPNGKRCIDIKQNGNGDVGSVWLELIAKKGKYYKSKVCLSPERTVNGGFLNFYFDFNSWIAGTWASIAFAALNSKQRLNIAESKVKNKGVIPGIENSIQALNNPKWTAGRFSNKTFSKTGVDDVQFKLGWNYYFRNLDHVGFYFVATAPTGEYMYNKFIFEPIVGHKNGSAGVGLNTDYTTSVRPKGKTHWMVDLKYRYEFSHCSRRLFDLCKNGPWSRYLLVARKKKPNIPLFGVNYFTAYVKAATRNTVDFWTALHYNYCDFHLEIGYDLYWRANEKLCLKNCKEKSLHVGIYDINSEFNKEKFTTAGDANITETACEFGKNCPESDPVFETLSTKDFNLSSGSRPTALTNTFYGAFSYNSQTSNNTSYMLGFVAFYEFAHGNTAFEQWSAQVKTAIGF